MDCLEFHNINTCHGEVQSSLYKFEMLAHFHRVNHDNFSLIVSCSIAAIFGSASTSKTGGFTFGATSVSSSGAATSKPLGGVDTGFGFRKRANDADDNPVKRNKGIVVWLQWLIVAWIS